MLNVMCYVSRDPPVHLGGGVGEDSEATEVLNRLKKTLCVHKSLGSLPDVYYCFESFQRGT